MRVILRGNTVQLEDTTGIVQSLGDYHGGGFHQESRSGNRIYKIGFFFYDNEHWGGWIRLPVPFSFECEVVSHKSMTIHGSRIIEFILPNLSELIQVANQLRDNLIEWKLPEKKQLVTSQQVDISINKIIDEVKDYIEEIPKQQEKLVAELQNKEEINKSIIANQSRQIIEKIDFYLNVVNDQIISSYIGESKDKYTEQLQEGKAMISTDGIEKAVWERKLENMVKKLDKLKKKHGGISLEKSQLIALKAQNHSLYQDVKNMYGQFMRAENRDHRNRNKQLNGWENKSGNDLKRIITSAEELEQKISGDLQKIEEVEKEGRLIQEKQKRQEESERKVLDILGQLKEGIQTQLSRIAELSALDKEDAQKTILRLLNKDPNLGEYDNLSQVFILGDDIGRKIDELIEQFERESVK